MMVSQQTYFRQNLPIGSKDSNKGRAEWLFCVQKTPNANNNNLINTMKSETYDVFWVAVRFWHGLRIT
jgi:hypothetical protein